jgi:hypothetical protein
MLPSPQAWPFAQEPHYVSLQALSTYAVWCFWSSCWWKWVGWNGYWAIGSGRLTIDRNVGSTAVIVIMTIFRSKTPNFVCIAHQEH